MTLKYWFKNIYWGLLFFGISIYMVYDKPQTSIIQLLMALALLSGLLFPFAKNTIERVALRYTTRESWTTGLYKETPAKNGLYAMYYMLIFIAAIPIWIIYLVSSKKTT